VPNISPAPPLERLRPIVVTRPLRGLYDVVPSAKDMPFVVVRIAEKSVCWGV
jgi:hypothetical protein